MSTKYQDLTAYFKSLNSYSSDEMHDLPTDTVIYKGSGKKDRAEYERVKLQKQQTKYLKKQWSSVKYATEQQKLIHEAQRLPAYLDYDLMSYHEIIGRALEIYAEESVCQNDEGNVLNIVSSNDRIKDELQDLFFNRLHVHTNLYVWTYETIKNGDCFLHLDLDDELGVVSARIIPPTEMERIEGDYADRFLNNTKEETKFRWRTQSIIEFKYWSIAHFRLLLDQKKLPYGASILEKARRLWRNLLLAEDAMLSMQIIRGIDRLAYYVDVGNIDPDDVPAYINEYAQEFKRKVHVDENGQINLKHNILAIDQDYFIPKRGNNDSSKIEKIEGQTQMDTNVVDYLMKKLIATLGIPQPYLNYDNTAGEGKTLSMQDIRVARTVQRIQQAMLMEMNKIAMIHLILLGLEDQIGNFQLSLNNPSIQSEILKLDLLSQKMALFKDATDLSGGIAPYSVTRAKKEILNMSNDEIVLDMEQQRLERAAIEELENTPEVIPKSGIFKNVDAIYGDPSAQLNAGDEEDMDGDDLSFSGGGGGGSIGGGNMDLGDEDFEGEPGEEEMSDEMDLGSDEEGGMEEPSDENMEESISKHLNHISKLLKD
jgi:hypothetical protein